jgi:hypothetical protein
MLTTRRILGAAGLVGLAAAGSSQSAQRTVTFAFAPPHGTTFLEITRIERETQSETGQPPERTVTEERGRYLIEKTEQGYLVSQTPVRPKDLVLSEDAQRIVPQLLSQMKLQYELDPSGRLLRVLGAESGLRMLTDAFGKDLKQLIVKSLGSNTMDEAAARMWNNRGLLAPFAGQTVVVGEERSTNGTVPLPIGGSVTGNVRIAVNGPNNHGGVACHTIGIRMSSEDKAIGVAIAKTVNDMFAGVLRILEADAATKTKVPRFRCASHSLSVEIERLVDARSGLPHGEKMKSVLEATVSMDGIEDRLPFRVSETRTSRFEYQ